ncbi:MAG: ABC transporter substrate-binding protein, partial [Propionibacteriaceae bacterium]|nr:ABC transporter substrate-binding protein [Propionibacteriaceae bacterium]
IGYTQQAALPTRKIDASVGFINNDFVQFELAGVNVIALPITEGSAPPLVGASLFTTRSFVVEHPEIAKWVAEAMAKGIDATAADQSAAVETAAKYIPDMTEQAKKAAKATLGATLKIMLKDGKASKSLDPAQWQAMAVFLADAKVLSSIPDVSQVVGDTWHE